MNLTGIKTRIETLTAKAGDSEIRVTEVHRIIFKPGPRIEGEDYGSNPIPTGQVIIRKVGQQ